MSQEKQIYRCNICGNMVEVIQSGKGNLSCDGLPMQKLSENTEGLGPQKHVPVIEKAADGVKVKIGEVEHPMDENHCIQWIELTTDNCIYRKVLKPGDKPEAEFKVDIEHLNEVTACEYCSIHGLWESK